MNNIVNDKKICVSLDQFKNYFLTHNYNENMFNYDGSINPNYNSNKKTGIIAQIFEDHFDTFYAKNKCIIDKLRPNAPCEVKKIIDCHNKNLGCSAYECPNVMTLFLLVIHVNLDFVLLVVTNIKILGLKTYYKVLFAVTTDKLFLLFLKK